MKVVLLEKPEVRVTSVRCRGEFGPAPREVEGVDAFELCLVRDGCFRVRGSKMDAFGDPETCLLGGPGHVADVTHPKPGGDLSTFVAISGDVLAALGGGATHLPVVVPATAPVRYAHLRLLTAERRGDEPMVVEEHALVLFAAALAQAEPARVAAGHPTGRAHRRLADDARAMLIADPTLSSVVEMARLLGCSPYHLSRVFVEQVGKGIAQYRIAVRVNRALEQLAAGATHLGQVAADCGFADHAHLTRTLRQHLNTTPSHLRRVLDGPN